MARQKSNVTATNIKQPLDKNMLVPVANFTTGTLIYVNNRNGTQWKWDGFGSIDDIELSELITIKSSQPKFLTEPWMYIMDEDVVEHLGLSKMYETIMMPEDVDGVFDMPNAKLEELLNKSPSGMKQIIALRAKDLIAQGKFDSLSKKYLIERILNVKLTDEE